MCCVYVRERVGWVCVCVRERDVPGTLKLSVFHRYIKASREMLLGVD
jgi:hypothetical protein